MSDERNDEIERSNEVTENTVRKENDTSKPVENSSEFINTLKTKDTAFDDCNDKKTMFENNDNSEQIKEKNIFCTKKHEELDVEVKQNLDYLFKENCICYRFIDNNWDCVGKGSFMVAKYQDKNRIIFVLDNSVSVYIDFVVMKNLGNELKKRNVVMYCYGAKCGAFCFRFEDENKAKEANELVTYNE